MKRNLVFLLTGFLAISSLSAGLPSYQVMAAEADGSSEYAQQAEISFLVMDENGIILDQGSQYSLTEGETCVIDVFWDDLPADTLPSYKWTSESPDIISITEDGSLTALSSGTGRIVLSISGDTQTETTAYTIAVEEAEVVEETEEAEVAEETAEAEDAEAVEETEEAEDTEVAEETAEAEDAEDAEETAEAEDAEVAEETAEAEDAEVAEEIAEAEDVEVVEETEAAEEEPEEENSASYEAEIVGEVPTEEVSEQVVTSEDEIPEEIIVAEVSVASANAPAKAGISDEEPSTVQTGWVKDGDQYRYFGEDGVALTGWQIIGGYRYYFDPETQNRVTGIQKIGGKLYVFSPRGARYNGTRFVETSKGTCFVSKSGVLVKGWHEYNHNWYYFDDNGLMKTGKLVLDGKIYWFNKNGVRQSSWYRGNNNLYYLDKKTGEAAVGWKILSGKKYLFSHNGTMKKGWYRTSSRMFYIGKEGYVLSGLRKIGNIRYYLRQDGVITKGWKKINKYWYYFKSGKAYSGWLTLGSRKYYLNKNGAMLVGTHMIDGVSYTFNSDGSLRPSTNNYHNTEEFIACIAPLVQKYAPKYGVKVCSPIIAQAILESASGESSLGKKYNNFFGLKCGTLWTGPSVNLLTGEEYTVGQYTTITAAFRVYDNMEEGVKGYFEFLFRNRTRYNNLIGETDPYRYLEKIKADGYATSSQYVTNTYNVLKRYNLTRCDKK